MASAPIAISTRVLVEGMVSTDGWLEPALVYAVAGECGMSAQQVRLCLRRMTAEGMLVKHGRGRGARFQAIRPGGTLELARTSFLPLAYAQDDGQVSWDRCWRLLSFSVRESDRAARDALRYQLRFLGWAPLDGGLYVTVHPSEPLVRDVARRHGIEHMLTFAHCTELEVRQESDPRRLAKRLWPLDELALGYQPVLGLLRSPPPAVGTPIEHTLARLFAVAATFTRAIEFDPLLPPQLLPARWPGTTTRKRLRQWLRTALKRQPSLRKLTIAHVVPDGGPDPGTVQR